VLSVGADGNRPGETWSAHVISDLRDGESVEVVAILACHNRRESTVSCLDSLFAQDLPSRVGLSAVLVDGGSSDGTADAVESRFPRVHVLRESADLYWASAMAVAEKEAEKREPAYLLWLNDDVVLDPAAVLTLLDIAQSRGDRCIAVAPMRDPETGVVTYSGMQRLGKHPLRVKPVEPGGRELVVDTFNGNCVLVPAAVRAEVGSIDGRLVHSAADIDYGFRGTWLGIPTVLAGEPLGACVRDSVLRPWIDPSLTRRQRLLVLLGPKGQPMVPTGRMMRRHGGWRAVFFYLWLYLHAMIDLLAPRRPIDSTRPKPSGNG
jgi:GT2 family glycosyltransferase